MNTIAQRRREKALARLAPAKAHIHNAIHALKGIDGNVEEMLYEVREAINYLESTVSAVIHEES